MTDNKTAWKAIKEEKGDFTPQYYDIKDQNGKRVPMSQKAQAIAEYLRDKQWNHNERNPPTPIETDRPNLLNGLYFKTSDLEMQEVKWAIHKMKKGKAPGPDGTTIDLFKYLDDECLDIITSILQNMWRDKKVPNTFSQANVASLYKKGSHDNPANYRPISLLKYHL